MKVSNKSVAAEASFFNDLGVFWELWVKTRPFRGTQVVKGGFINDVTAISPSVLAIMSGDVGSITLDYPDDDIEALYASFRSEVFAAVDFRLANPGKWGQRDGIVTKALARCLTLCNQEVTPAAEG